jgi:hypothetical protein
LIHAEVRVLYSHRGNIVPAGAEYFHEVKWDGYRVRVASGSEPSHGGFPPIAIGGIMGRVGSQPPAENHLRRDARLWRARSPDLLLGLQMHPLDSERRRPMGAPSSCRIFICHACGQGAPTFGRILIGLWAWERQRSFEDPIDLPLAAGSTRSRMLPAIS